MPFFSCPNLTPLNFTSSIVQSENNFIINFSNYDFIENYAAAPPVNNTNTWVSSSINLSGYKRFLIKTITTNITVFLDQNTAPVQRINVNNLNITYQHLNFSLGLHNNAVLVPVAYNSANQTIFIPPVFGLANDGYNLINNVYTLNVNIPINLINDVYLHYLVHSRNFLNILDNNAGILAYIGNNSGITNLYRIYTFLMTSIQGEIY